MQAMSTPLTGASSYQGADSSSAATGRAAGVASPAPTPLAVRVWRRDTQRAVRLALLGIKDARSGYEAGVESGQRTLSELCNELLALTYLQAMPAPTGAQAQVHPPQQAAAAVNKLRARVLRGCEAMQAVNWALAAHVQALDYHVGSLRALVEDSGALADSSGVFGAVTLRALVQLTSGALQAASQDATARSELCTCLVALPATLAESPAPKHEHVKARCVVWLASWLAAPAWEGVFDEVIGAMAEDMAGF